MIPPLKIISKIQTAISDMATGESPFYQLFPNHPEYDPARATAFRKSLEDLSRFQGEIIAARSATGDQRRARALDLSKRYYTGGPIQKAVAMELLYTLRDCKRRYLIAKPRPNCKRSLVAANSWKLLLNCRRFCRSRQRDRFCKQRQAFGCHDFDNLSRP